MTNIFAQQSEDYAAARPLYPAALFDWIAGHCQARQLAWDCGTGNGQAAAELARLFDRVEATDASPEQVALAQQAENIRYTAQPAERTSFGPATFDLVAVAQALHWFDYRLFWPEVRRVAKPGALFCAWGYAWFRGSDPVEQHLLEPVSDIVAPYWAAENRLLWDGYQPDAVSFPFQPLPAPDLRIEVDWTVRRIADYVRTWSAYKRAASDGHQAALDRTIEAAEAQLGPETRFALHVPLAILAGIVR